MINSNDLHFFNIIASHKTLSSAALALNISPPSVTLRLQGIEDRLGVKLLKRPSRYVSLTDEGKLILVGAHRIIKELDELQASIDNYHKKISGKLKILAPLGFGRKYIAPLLGRYMSSHPYLEVELTLSDASDWFSFNQWDLVIYIGNLKDSSMRCIKLASNQRFLCAAPAYLERYSMPMTPSELQQHVCIALRENNEDVTLWNFQQNKKNISIRIQPQYSSNEGATVKEWALSGLGIAMRSEWDVAAHFRNGDLIQILPGYQLPNADIVILTSENSTKRSAKIEKFIQLLQEAFLHTPWNTDE